MDKVSSTKKWLYLYKTLGCVKNFESSGTKSELHKRRSSDAYLRNPICWVGPAGPVGAEQSNFEFGQFYATY